MKQIVMLLVIGVLVGCTTVTVKQPFPEPPEILMRPPLEIIKLEPKHDR